MIVVAAQDWRLTVIAVAAIAAIAVVQAAAHFANALLAARVLRDAAAADAAGPKVEGE